MNAGLLLNALSLIGDDPDRVSQIRKIAVALAITGKLDSRAVSLRPAQIVESVNRVKAELVKSGSLPKQKQYAPVTQVDLPEAFADPSVFAPLGEIARIEKGKTGIQQAKPGSFPLVVTAAERARCDHFDFDGAAAIIPLVSSTGHGNASLNRLHYQEGKFALGTILAGVFPHEPRLISARFLFEYLSAFKDELLVTRMTGTANVTLTIGGIAEVPIPLVCPEVQNRVDELMALCDRLEATRAEREATRDRLAASSLARLNAPDPETFQADARFVFHVLPALTTRPDQIKQFRQTILNLAVRGKLVPQDPGDEPASELLAKKRALPSGYQRRRKILKDTSIEAPAALFPGLPSSWVYVDIQTLYDRNIVIDYADGNHGSLYPRGSEFGDSGVTFVSAKDLNDGKVIWGSCSKLNQAWADQLTKGWAQSGDILLTHNATVGRVARVTEKVDPFLLGTSVTFYRLNAEVLCPDFFFYLLQSPLWQGQLEAIMEQTTRNQVSIQKQAFFRIALPPLAEQHRIVAKVDELMALTDRLEASLDIAAATRRRLLDALLAEALAPAAAHEEAA